MHRVGEYSSPLATVGRWTEYAQAKQMKRGTTGKHPIIHANHDLIMMIIGLMLP
jgi:hypothetical protein